MRIERHAQHRLSSNLPMGTFGLVPAGSFRRSRAGLKRNLPLMLASCRSPGPQMALRSARMDGGRVPVRDAKIDALVSMRARSRKEVSSCISPSGQTGQTIPSYGKARFRARAAAPGISVIFNYQHEAGGGPASASLSRDIHHEVGLRRVHRREQIHPGSAT
jgi:hypothetical protein